MRRGSRNRERTSYTNTNGSSSANNTLTMMTASKQPWSTTTTLSQTLPSRHESGSLLLAGLGLGVSRDYTPETRKPSELGGAGHSDDEMVAGLLRTDDRGAGPLADDQASCPLAAYAQPHQVHPRRSL
jgi:hypothetical protein